MNETTQPIDQLPQSITARPSLSYLRARKAELQESILKLRTQLDALESELSDVVYPVLEIPDEVTQQILAAAEPSELLVISAVCSQWRRIALGTKALWAHISLGTAMADLESLFFCFLDRAQDLAIHLTVAVTHPWKVPIAILSTTGRWKTAHFLPSSQDSLGQLYLPLDTGTSLDFGLLEEFTGTIPRLWPELFSGASLLQSLACAAAELALRFPVQNLTKLELTMSSSVSTLASLLRLTTRLEILIFGSASFLEEGALDAEPFPVHERLHTISCERFMNEDIFQRLTVPALKTIYLRSLHVVEALVECLSRSRCTLRALYLATIPPSGYLKHLLQSAVCASVRELILTVDEQMAPEDAAEFYSNLAEGTYLPALKKLTLDLAFTVDLWPYVDAVAACASERPREQGTEDGPSVSKIEDFVVVFPMQEVRQQVSDLDGLRRLERVFGVRLLVPNGIPSFEKW
uniref:F-box domain-containing protein n=1 Tax=Mycena chlorophos TaxID=658473 RepID=A0ABQ0M1V9_MYCCL|nr:predicted protein [Mycena chlorophos]